MAFFISTWGYWYDSWSFSCLFHLCYFLITWWKSTQLPWISKEILRIVKTRVFSFIPPLFIMTEKNLLIFLTKPNEFLPLQLKTKPVNDPLLLTFFISLCPYLRNFIISRFYKLSLCKLDYRLPFQWQSISNKMRHNPSSELTNIQNSIYWYYDYKL